MSDVQDRIKQTVESNDIVLFMKGSPQFPQCGFSGRAVQILQACGAEFASVDVLSDPEVREGIKQYSSWPTIPQLYVKGQFLGGSDIMMEMYENGELKQALQAESQAENQGEAG
jgi:monothiol glutaredoxin